MTARTGAALQTNELSFYGGSNRTLEPSLVYGGSQSNWDYFVAVSGKQDDLGIENTTASHKAIHDDTDQAHAFMYLAYHLDHDSTLSVLLNGAYGDFQIPDTTGLPQALQPSGPSRRHLGQDRREPNRAAVLHRPVV